MIQILHGWGRQALPLSNARGYYPEELARLCSRRLAPFWLEVAGRPFQLAEQEYDLALRVAAQYHNATTRNEPGGDEEAEGMEERARTHMEAPDSDPEEYVASDEDLVYEKHFYM